MNQRLILRVGGPRAAALVACSILMLAWLMAGRILGPSDASNQTQPKTTAYTTDMLVNGRWMLPLERAELPATKPPLYNWFAAPVVRLLGYSSEIGHRFPSLLAAALCWLVMMRLGRAIDGPALGALAATAFIANYTIFKLAYLARPDMLLTLWLLLGWCAATAILVQSKEGIHRSARRGRRGETGEGRGAGEASVEGTTRHLVTLSPSHASVARSRRWVMLAFWTCTGLAALTKGPPAVVLPLYALAGARWVAGSWRAAGAFGWWWGAPLALLLGGSWMAAVWRIDPVHLRQTLWQAEILGRVTGLGPEGSHSGPWGLLTSLPNQALYYLLRFSPWSIMSIAALAWLWRRGSEGGSGSAWSDSAKPHAAWRGMGPRGAWLQGAAVFVILVIALFSVSAGKRADYIAAAFAPGALLAGWWMHQAILRRRWVRAWMAPASACLVMSAMTIANQLELNAPARGFDAAIMRFIRQTEEQLRLDPRPIAFCWTGTTHVKAYLGYSEPDRPAPDGLRELAARGEPFWIVAGKENRPPTRFDEFLAVQLPELTLQAVVRSAELPQARGWPTEMTLYEARPAGH